MEDLSAEAEAEAVVGGSRTPSTPRRSSSSAIPVLKRSFLTGLVPEYFPPSYLYIVIALAIANNTPYFKLVGNLFLLVIMWVLKN